MSERRQEGQLLSPAVPAEPPEIAEVYVDDDGRPALLLNRKNMGAWGDGWQYVSVTAGIAVTAFVPDSKMPDFKRYTPMLPEETKRRLEELEGRTADAERENEALKHALKTAVAAVDGETAERIRDTYRRWRPRTSA